MGVRAGHNHGMGITVKTWPEGRLPTYSDATLMLDIDVAVVPQLDVVMVEDDSDYYVRGILIYSLSEGYYIPREVTVGMRSLVTEQDFDETLRGMRLKSEPPVSSVSLRHVRVAELVKHGAAWGIFLRFKEYDRPASLISTWGVPGDSESVVHRYAHLARTASSEEILRHLGAVYMVAVMAGDSPAQAVERDFGMAKRTAANWIARAKSEGHIRIPGVISNNGEH